MRTHVCVGVLGDQKVKHEETDQGRVRTVHVPTYKVVFFRSMNLQLEWRLGCYVHVIIFLVTRPWTPSTSCRKAEAGDILNPMMRFNDDVYASPSRPTLKESQLRD
jgi:hypothetical protein